MAAQGGGDVCAFPNFLPWVGAAAAGRPLAPSPGVPARLVASQHLLSSQDSGRLCGDSGLAAFRAAEGERRWQLGPSPSRCVGQSQTRGSASSPFPGRLSLDSQDGDSGLESGTERFPSVSEVRASPNRCRGGDKWGWKPAAPHPGGLRTAARLGWRALCTEELALWL